MDQISPVRGGWTETCFAALSPRFLESPPGARQVPDLLELQSCISDSAVLSEAPHWGVLLFLSSHFSTLLLGPSLV